MNNHETTAETLIFAESAPAQPSFGEAMMQMLPLMVFIFAIFYFVYQRPMNKERESHERMVKGLIRGVKVLTIGGIHGEVVDVQDLVVVIKTGGNSKITVSKTSIKNKLTPASGGD